MRHVLTLICYSCLLISTALFAQDTTDTKPTGLINTLPLYQDDLDALNGVKGTIVLPHLRVNNEETSLLGGEIHLDLPDGVNGTCQVTKSLLIPRTNTPAIDEDFDPTLAEQLNTILMGVQEVVASGIIPGVTMRVEIAGKTWRAVVGKSRISTNEARIYSNHFRIGSISKTFTAAALLLLYQNHVASEDGKTLTLDDTMEKWFQDESWYSKIPNADKITVRYLLRHQSGLYNYVGLSDIQDAMLNDPTRVYTPEELIDLSYQGNPSGNFEPGTQVEYSNTNFILAGLLIEKITGQSAEKVIRDTVFKPLKMFNSMLGTDPAMPYYYDHGYVDADSSTPEIEWKDISYFDSSVAWTSGSVISNLDDLSTGFKCQVSRSESCPEILFSQETLDERMDYTTIEESGFKVNYGLGLLNICDFPYHVGAINGYETAVFYHPDIPGYGEVTITVNTNMYFSYYDTSMLALEIITTLFPGQCDSSMVDSGTKTRIGQSANSFTNKILGLKPGQVGF